jgi:hypothetical protein
MHGENVYRNRDKVNERKLFLGCWEVGLEIKVEGKRETFKRSVSEWSCLVGQP